MSFENFIQAQSVFLWAIFAVAFLMGAVVNKTNFCTMGAVSDWVNMGDTGRLRAWLFAIAVALLGVVVLEQSGLVMADSAFPPYRGSQLIWAENLLGGILFGIGMTLASGCGNKTLVRIGGGNIKSIMVMIIIAIISYFMIYPLPGSDQTLFTLLFYDWIRPLAITLENQQDLGTIIGGKENALMTRLILGGVLVVALLVLVFRSADFRSNRDNILGGLVVGLAVLSAWYITSNISVSIDDESMGLAEYVQNWDFIEESEEGKPFDSRPLNPQSFTFINPMGQTLGYTMQGFNSSYLTFGVMALAGVILGSLVWSLLARSFRIEWFASARDFFSHFIGAVLMGFGGVMAMGCTVGQAITGISTLAVGSFIAFAGIVFGSAMTMKIQYYKMVYEEEASFFSALVASLADMHLVPAGMRKLDKI